MTEGEMGITGRDKTGRMPACASPVCRAGNKQAARKQESELYLISTMLHLHYTSILIYLRI